MTSSQAPNKFSDPVTRTTSGRFRRRPHLTIRTRLTLAFTVLVAIAGLLMALIVNVFMRTVPTYFALHPSDSTAQETTAVIRTPHAGAGTLGPIEETGIMTLRSPGDILNTTFIVSMIVLIVLVIVGALFAWIVAGRMLRPLQAISRAAKLAGSGSFDHRIGFKGPHDEVRDLSDTFDEMIERLDRTFRSHQRFAANASHELRTPLAITQTMLEVALADPDLNLLELRTVAQRVLETNSGNIETVGALLDLADIDRRPLVAHKVNLDRLIRQAVAAVVDEAAARNISVAIESAGASDVFGDEVLLRQAITNLVRNAVRHNVANGDLLLSVEETACGVRVRVENTGPELSVERAAELTEPFTRGAGRTASAAESVRGHGLGLAIVSSVVDAHHGTLWLAPREGGGLVVELVLPSTSISNT